MPMTSWRRLGAIAIVLAALTAACGGKLGGAAAPAGNGAPAGPLLYDRIGGRDAIAAVVDDFIANVIADERINAYFAAADVPGLKEKLVDQLCEASGGPCKYTGKNMRDAHADMGVSQADFDALVEDLAKALEAHDVGEREKAELLQAIGAMQPDIVTAGTR